MANTLDRSAYKIGKGMLRLGYLCELKHVNSWNTLRSERLREQGILAGREQDGLTRVELLAGGFLYCLLCSVSPSPGSDISMQTQPVSVCTHFLFLCACEQVCTIPLGARFRTTICNKRATSLPGDGEKEYNFWPTSSVKSGAVSHDNKSYINQQQSWIHILLGGVFLVDMLKSMSTRNTNTSWWNYLCIMKYSYRALVFLVINLEFHWFIGCVL